MKFMKHFKGVQAMKVCEPLCHPDHLTQTVFVRVYSGRKIAESLGNVTVRGGKDGKSKRGARLSTVCLYSLTENIYSAVLHCDTSVA
jgi:hypothetical protein